MAPTPVPDALSIAAQLGRLDLVSVLLAGIGMLAIFAGLFAFGFVSGSARATAKATAEQIAEKRLTELVRTVEARLADMESYANRRPEPTSKPAITEVQEAEDATEGEKLEG